jgi:hypothetical protein
MFDGGGTASIGGDDFTPIQDPQEPILDLKKLALHMLKQTLFDIGDSKLRGEALVWVNDTHPDTLGWVTSFTTVCELMDLDIYRTRLLLNLFAASGLSLERLLDRGGLAGLEKPGKKKTRRR